MLLGILKALWVVEKERQERQESQEEQEINLTFFFF
jgi:hypothetical protein